MRVLYPTLSTAPNHIYQQPAPHSSPFPSPSQCNDSVALIFDGPTTTAIVLLFFLKAPVDFVHTTKRQTITTISCRYPISTHRFRCLSAQLLVREMTKEQSSCERVFEQMENQNMCDTTASERKRSRMGVPSHSQS